MKAQHLDINEGKDKIGKMVKSLGRIGKILAILTAAIAAFSAIPAFADGNEGGTKTVRLGYVNVSGYEEGLEGEYKTGLGYEYFQNIAYLENWEYEYVYGSFSELLEMLINGEIDVFGNVSYTPERAELISYSDYAMGKDVYHIAVLADNTELRQGDVRAYNGKRVGVTRGSYQASLLREWVSRNSLDMEIAELSGSEDLLDGLNSGELDCIAYPKLINQSRYAATFYIGSSDYYFAVSKQRPDLLEDINNALYSIQSGRPLYNEMLNAKYENNVLTDVLLTEPEREWLDKHPEIAVGYIDGYLPFSESKDNGELDGALPVIMNTLREKLRLEDDMRFRYVPYKSAKELIAAVQTGEVNVAFPMSGDFYYCEENGIMQSYDVVTTAAALVHKGQYGERKLERLGVIEGNELMRVYTELHYPDCEIVYFKDPEDCLKAINDGAADGAVFNMSRAQYFISCGDYSDIFMTLCPKNAEYVFAVKKGESALLMILNRGINAMDSTYPFAVLNEYVPYNNEFSLKDFIVENIAAVLITGSVLLLLIGAAVLLYVIKIKHINGELSRALENYRQADSDRRTDFLTGLRSRQDMFEMIESAVKGDNKSITAVYMIDVDNFKMLNDNFGHAYGDECLRKIGSALTEYGKENDMVFYRYGGEEILGLCFSGKRSADETAREIVQRVRDLKIARDDVPVGIVTISLGYTADSQHYEKMIKMADAALYEAKGNGRNRAVCYDTLNKADQ